MDDGWRGSKEVRGEGGRSGGHCGGGVWVEKEWNRWTDVWRLQGRKNEKEEEEGGRGTKDKDRILRKEEEEGGRGTKDKDRILRKEEEEGGRGMRDKDRIE
ncbi:hypothetical protein Pcinc_042738 [Petrolisthes cinctipes]|uniref:Uncharacterized protein n=1 Tax=Petrolisthes cinctipes TaxID=88211 RepID=A0AAE1BGW2_PETCI|nr:hypothetical protein Pcinc_042738 [Petrolisthes cinctipes]